MHLVLDANEYIFGFGTARKPSSERLLTLVTVNPDEYLLSICRPIVSEVEKHLLPLHQREFHVYLNALDVEIHETWMVPFEFVERYIASGLKRGDAFVAGYTEWIGAEVLISENRKDLVDHPDLFPFQVSTAEKFLKRHH